MMHSDVVINLIGREYETMNFKFEDVNIHGPKLLAKLARECGVKDFIHISALNAREKPKVRSYLIHSNKSTAPDTSANIALTKFVFICLQRLYMPKGSNFLKTKWLGEKAVLEEFPDATIIRPADMYGTGDYMTT